ncbi:COMM domain-containing protein 1-like [Hydractinia symbiolongicarpus]|uniref:COMM domain-containing protein 1-like n=1 Tax=Hydractinia symbiolongicarpus TaxID=13093 RepID=UPI00254A1485|nr:COMM domain-containing protein 1-like [Hydractinia symbiolongicarpus]
MADKTISGLLNGFMKREYFGEIEITDDFLKEQLFPEESTEAFSAILLKYQSILNNIVYSDMELKQLEAFLTSQMKKKPDYLSEAQAAAITKFWKTNKHKIHDVIVTRSTWNNHLKTLKWRIDVSYENKEKGGEPKAIFEMDMEKRVLAKKHEKILFEVDIDKLDDMISQVEKIEQNINDIVN